MISYQRVTVRPPHCRDSAIVSRSLAAHAGPRSAAARGLELYNWEDECGRLAASDVPAGAVPANMKPGTIPPAVRRQPGRTFLQRALLALAIALPGAPLWAVGEVNRANTASSAADEIAWMSGGVGDQALAEMRAAAAAYNVHLLFSDQRGSYLAAIPFTIARLAAGNEQPIYSAISEGPLLYLKLPPGSYQIAAQIDGVWQSQRVQASSGGSAIRLSFVSSK